MIKYLFVFLLTISFAYSQENLEVSGLITDAKGNAVPFASIYVEGTSISTMANDAGMYKLKLDTGKYVLVFRYVGFKQKERELLLEKPTILDVILDPDVYVLSEVTVGKKEDPAYPMIRKVMSNRKYLMQTPSYSCDVYTKVFILPLNAVMESLQPREEDLHPLAGGERVLEVRGEYLPLVELWKVFEVDGAKTEATQGIVVILQSAGRRYALLVDQLIGQHQVVVKNLESNYRKVPGISAATILGDGSVALIVDVSALQGLNREQRVANTAA